ncbi:MAG: DMT family transporter, partial [Clostridiaceae bacterium]|nr:DMT family transporter [Clostridiaceae bacterium]
VSIIISVAPFFTSLFDWLFMKGEKPGRRFLTGFTAAMLGISLLSFQKGTGVQLSPKGDLLALAAAITWAAYSILTKKIGSYGYGTIESTRRTFFTVLSLWYRLCFSCPSRLHRRVLW